MRESGGAFTWSQSRPGWGLRRWLIAVAVAGWTVLLLLGLAVVAERQWIGDLGCEASTGDSNYGTHGWSVLPPGPTCTYTRDLNGYDQVDGPTPAMSIWLAGLAIGGVICVTLVRRSSRAA
jgi:hypothetical protein